MGYEARFPRSPDTLRVAGPADVRSQSRQADSARLVLFFSGPCRGKDTMELPRRCIERRFGNVARPQAPERSYWGRSGCCVGIVQWVVSRRAMSVNGGRNWPNCRIGGREALFSAHDAKETRRPAGRSALCVIFNERNLHNRTMAGRTAAVLAEY